jgi:hypothetical protein
LKIFYGILKSAQGSSVRSLSEGWWNYLELLHPLPHLGSEFARTGSQAFLIHADNLFALHQNLTAAHSGIYNGIHEPENEVAQEIFLA